MAMNVNILIDTARTRIFWLLAFENIESFGGL